MVHAERTLTSLKGTAIRILSLQNNVLRKECIFTNDITQHTWKKLR